MSKFDLSAYQDTLAIVGMACRLPGARNVEQFWQNLQAGKEAVSFFSEQELRAAGIEARLLSNPDYIRASAVLEDIERFDAAFFGYTPREAELIDPQQRIFLECAWEALEHAGYGDDRQARRVGVYAGVGINTYLLSNLLPHPELIENAGWLQMMVSNEKDHLATRVSYKLNLCGPSVTVSTACSTSLVAIHLACQSLLNGECDLCLAGGVSVKVPAKSGYLYLQGGTSSPDGHCRAFDARAQGTVPGNGAGIVVLKRLSEALADGDCIHALIRGSAINNDGAAKIGYTAPGVQGQASVIAEALAVAGVDAGALGYVEAHGTGTALGDPIEIKALSEAFALSSARKQWCALGSVKTNLGHLDTAAGVAGVIKTVLALEHRTLPPSLHFQQPNPAIDFAASPFYVNAALSDWPTTEHRRLAGVNSLGLGGTNAHLILEEAPPAGPAQPATSYQLLPLSARTPAALEALCSELGRHLQAHPQLDLAAVASTLQVGRKPFPWRTFLVGESIQQAARVLQPASREQLPPPSMAAASPPEVVLLFPGQGLQHVDMALGLYQEVESFRQDVEHCARLLLPLLGYDLRQVLYPEQARRQKAAQQLEQMEAAQPALFTIEYAVARLWMAWGIRPAALVGHSLGEYVAACLAGVFSLEDALALVVVRSRLMQKQPAGAMLTVGLSPQALEPYLHAHLSLAAHNSPADCVVAGLPEAIAELETRLQAEGISFRRIPVPRAAHSLMLDPVLEEFYSQVCTKQLHAPELPLLSNVTGTWITPQEASDPAYWVRHLRHTVRFAQQVQVLTEGGRKLWLEVGPGRTLTTLVQRTLGLSSGHVLVRSLRHPQDSGADLAYLWHASGLLWASGQVLLWEQMHPGRRQRVPLPTYPFERQVCWVAPGKRVDAPTLEKKTQVADWFSTISWKRVPLPADLSTDAEQRWLIFADDAELICCLTRELARAGLPATIVGSGEQFCHQSDARYLLNLRQPADYLRLLHELAGRSALPTHVLHAWALLPAAGEEHAALDARARFEQTQARGFFSLLSLLQALGELAVHDPLHLLLLTDRVQDVLGGEVVEPALATLPGLGLVIPFEYPHITCRTLDTGQVHTEGGYRMLARQIVREGQVPGDEEVVAYRGAYRWVREIVPLRVGERPAHAPLHLREQGVYIILGGTGGIGLTLAEYLAREVHARLVLVGRAALPPPERRGCSDLPDETAQKIQALQRLEAAGAAVCYVQADITNQGQVRALLQQTQQTYGALHGLIHAAGIPGEGLLQRKSFEQAARVLAPKVQSLLVLEQALRGRSLDFLLLCSSLASIFGGPGLGDYAASNAFLDAFASFYTASSGTPTFSINWDTWREIGMARGARRQQFLKHVSPQASAELEGSIEPAEGQAVLAYLLDGQFPAHVLVSPRDMQALRQYHLAHLCLQAPGAAVPVEQPAASAHPRQATAPYVAARNQIEQDIARIWQSLLGIAAIGVHDNYFEIGGDSVMIIQIIRLLHETFQLTLPMHLLFEAPTIAALAQIVEQRQAEQSEQARLAALIEQVGQLSEEEVLLQLQRRS